MKEINRHILINGLSGLPEHSAPADIWDKTEVMIYSFPVDNLPIHKPGIAAWNNISKSINSTRYWNSGRLVVLSLLLVTILTGSVIIWNLNVGIPDNNNQSTNYLPPIVLEQQDSDDFDNKAIVKTDIPQQDEIAEDIGDELAITGHETGKITSNNNPKKEIIHSSYNTDIIDSDNDNYIVDMDEHRISRSFLSIQMLQLIGSARISDYKVDNESNMELTSIVNKASLVVPPQDYCSFNRIEKSILVGVGLGYQHVLNNSLPDDTKIEYWFTGDIRVQFKRERFSFETGIGVGYSSDKSKFSYDYTTNELVDTYEYVDSVHYDPITGLTEYFTTTVEVWDSVAYSSSAYLKQKYSYANIPIRFGYSFYNTKKFCMDFAIGGNYYFEISRNSQIPNIEHDNSTIGPIENVQTIRKSQFYNLEAGLGVSLILHDNLKLRIDPSIMYYPVGIYTNYNKETITASLRAGLYFKF